MGWDDWKWTDRGRGEALRKGITMAEVTDVRYAPDAVRRRLGDTLQVRAAVASSGRAIMVVMSDAGKTGMWEVWGLRLISDPEMRRLRKDADDQL